MKDKIPFIASILLGVAFLVFGLNFFLGFLEVPKPEPGSPTANFMGAMFTSGFLRFVKLLEIAGGVLVIIPKTRRLGLLVLTPIVVNILGYVVFLNEGAGLFAPPVLAVTVLTAFLLVTERSFLKQLIG